MELNYGDINTMNYIKQSIWALVAIAMVACSSDDDKETTDSLTPVVSKSTSFTASIESGNTTRTSLSTTSNPYPIWSSTDNINVYNKATQDDADFTISKGAGERAAEFNGTINVDKNEENNKFYAVYCANRTGANAPTLVDDEGTVKLSATIPANQSTTPGFHPDLHFMTACTTGSTFKFKNAMSLLKVTINNNYENFRICRIRFTSNSTEDVIAGKFEAPIGNDGTLGTYSIIDKTEDETETEEEIPTPSNEIVIDNGTSALGNGDYYIAILPCKFPYGFTLTFEDVSTDGNVKVYDRIKSATPDKDGNGFKVGASEIIDLGSYSAKACAKEAYVDLGITNSDGKKILWGIENIFDDNENSTVDNSYYAWGETLVKANQEKAEDYLKTYSWYFQYYVNEVTKSVNDGTEKNRAYLLGLGASNYNAGTHSESYNFIYNSWGITYTGKLIKYNSSDDYNRTAGDPYSIDPDGDTELGSDFDAAYQKSTRRMQIASASDFETLVNNSNNNMSDLTIPLVCGPAKDSNNKIYKFMNRSTGHYILLPLNGYRFMSSSSGSDAPQDTGLGYYWTRNRADAAADSYKAKAFKISTTSGGSITNIDRAAGLMLRGVMYR